MGLLIYAANILNISIFNALSIGSGLVAAVLMCMKRDDIEIIIDITSKSLVKHQRQKIVAVIEVFRSKRLEGTPIPKCLLLSMPPMIPP